MRIAVGPASTRLGEKIAENLGLMEVGMEFKEFPDGETYVRVGEIEPREDILLVQSMAPPQARNLMVLVQMISAIRDCTAGKIVAVVPYLAFARQDKAFLKGEAISAKAIAKAIEANEVDALLIVEPHSEESFSWFRRTAIPIDPLQDLASFLRVSGDMRPVIAPDKGRLQEAKALAEMLGTRYGWVEKVRDRRTGELVSNIGELPVKRGSVLLFDDLISTGGTIANAAGLLKAQGIESIEVATVHGLFVHEGDVRILQSGVSSIYAADTIEGKYTAYSVARSVSQAVEKLSHGF